MTITYSTSFAGIAEDQHVDAFDATWAAHPLSAAVLRGYAGADRLESYGTTMGRALYYNTSSGVLSDCKVEMDVTIRTAHAEHGVCARLDTTANSLYGLRIGGDGVQLVRVVNGTFLTLGTDYAHTFVVGNTYKLGVRCVGNQIYGMLDGVDVIGPITDSSHASGYPGIRSLNSTTAQTVIETFSVDNLAASDTTAPTLTSPTASATGATTASGSVSTNEANGTLYYLASANATELVATVKAGSSQAVTATGVQNVTVTGLTASTNYYLHFVHTDAAANDSTVATSAQFTTSAANTSPSFTGPNIADISGTEAVALTPVDVSARFFDSESGLTFSAVGSWPAGVTVSSAGVISGTPTTAGTYASLQVRATDAGSLTADSNAFSITVAAPAVAGINVTDPLKNNTGTVLASQSGVRVAVLQSADLVSVYEATGLTTNASGILATISNAAITTGQQYHVAIKLADGSVGITGPITAS